MKWITHLRNAASEATSDLHFRGHFHLACVDTTDVQRNAEIEPLVRPRTFAMHHVAVVYTEGAHAVSTVCVDLSYNNCQYKASTIRELKVNIHQYNT